MTARSTRSVFASSRPSGSIPPTLTSPSRGEGLKKFARRPLSGRPVEHFEVQPLAEIRVRRRHRLVELDAEARRGRRDDVAVLPDYRRLQDLGMEAAPILDALEDEKIGRAGADLDVGGALDRPAIEGRRDLRV